ncbi:hypothetical protein EGW08_022834, partial [Elysia chlorotica]
VPDEQQLYERIMGGYVKWVRPILNSSQPIKVKFAMRLNQIVSLDERQQVLTTNVFIDQTWTDPALAWDPTEFKDVRALRIPADQVWRPDTFIYNNADNGSTGFIDGTYIQIRHTGAVNWPVPVRLRSSCVVKITYFPFDRQYCMVRFGSWIYRLTSLFVSSLVLETPVLKTVIFVKSDVQILLPFEVNRTLEADGGGKDGDDHNDNGDAVIYLKRNTFFYLFNIIVPCCMLSVLTLMTFWLPPTSCEKVTLGLNVFLAFSMFMLLIAEEVPASSDAVPLIGVYLCVVMTMTSISVLCAVLVTNLHNRGSKLKAAPRWLARLFIRYLAAPMRVSKDVQLLASTIYLPEHSQFFFLYDDQWKSQNQGVRSQSDEKGNGPSKEGQVFVQASEGSREMTEKGDTSKVGAKSKQMTYDMESKQQTGDGRSHTLQPYCSDSHLGYGWTGSWERVAYEDHNDKEECSGMSNSRDSKNDMPCLYVTQDAKNSHPSHPEVLHMNVTGTDMSHGQISTKPEGSGQAMSVKSFAKNASPKSFDVSGVKKKTEPPALYQETSLCGGDSWFVTQQDRPQTLGKNINQTSSSTSYDHCSLTAPHFKPSLKPQQNFYSSLSPIDSDSEGAFRQLLPVLNDRQVNESPACEAVSRAISPHTHSEGDDDNESEVWVLRDDFKGANFTETNAEGVHFSKNKQQPKLCKTTVVPQSLPSTEHNALSTACEKPTQILSQSARHSRLVLKRARIMIAEWCIIAKVMDRILFILCLIATLFAYIFILIVVPLEFGTQTGNVTFVNTVNTGRYVWQQS